MSASLLERYLKTAPGTRRKARKIPLLDDRIMAPCGVFLRITIAFLLLCFPVAAETLATSSDNQPQKINGKAKIIR